MHGGRQLCHQDTVQQHTCGRHGQPLQHPHANTRAECTHISSHPRCTPKERLRGMQGWEDPGEGEPGNSSHSVTHKIFQSINLSGLGNELSPAANGQQQHRTRRARHCHHQSPAQGEGGGSGSCLAAQEQGASSHTCPHRCSEPGDSLSHTRVNPAHEFSPNKRLVVTSEGWGGSRAGSAVTTHPFTKCFGRGGEPR